MEQGLNALAYPFAGRTLSMMEIDPRLIVLRRNYVAKCRQQYEMMRNAFPGAWMQQQAMQSQPNVLSDLLGGLGGVGIGKQP